MERPVAGKPNEERPIPLVPENYVPPEGVRHPVRKGETWITIAKTAGIEPWELIDFNFPGTRRALLRGNPERAKRQVNWYRVSAA
jgi:hypothetical protein